MTKLLSILILAALSAFAPTVAVADDGSVCPDGYATVQSAGGPLCVNPIYLDGTWNDDPRDCVWGFFQGSCIPEPSPPEVLPVEAYTFQMDEPSPVYVAEVEAKRAVWLTVDELRLADLGRPR